MGESTAMPARWARIRCLPGLIQASLLLHLFVALGCVAQPALWPWWVALIVIDHLILMGAGLWPRAALLGRNWKELPGAARLRGGVALTIDDGPDPDVTPRTLEILARHGVRATFFCIGERALAHPELVIAMAAGGHAVENHTQEHRHIFSLFGPRRIYTELAAAQVTLGRLSGTPPRFFRAPAGLRNLFLEPVLARLGLQLVSWSRRGFDTREGDPRRVLKRLTAGLEPGAILLLHDGNAARTPQGIPVILDVLPVLIDRIRAAGLTPITLSDALPTLSDS